MARVIDVGSLEDGAPFMVLEYLEGADLSSFPRSQLTVGGIIDLVLQACEALAEAHSLGIVHRDIKPANFFITRGADGTLLLKVLDFGISKIATTNGQLTATQTVMGTPAYMSPEQMRSSRDVDHRSDIWSLGIVLYELLQGAPPFGGDTFSSMVLKVVNDPLPKLTVHLPGDLDSVIYRCLEKDPARRFQNIAELAYAIAKYAHSEAQASISVQRTRGIIGAEPSRALHQPGFVQRALPSTLSASAGARTRPNSGDGRRWSLLAVGIVGAVLVGGAIVAVASRSGGDASPRLNPATAVGETSTAAAEVPSPPADAQPSPVISPAPSVDRTGAAMPPGLDAGPSDASVMPAVVDAAGSPPHRSKPGSKAPSQPIMGGDHASQTRSTTPPGIDRGD